MNADINSVIVELTNTPPVTPPVMPKVSDAQLEWALRKMAEVGYDGRVSPHALNALARWTVAEVKGWSGKGLVLKGPVGTGKTLFFVRVLPRVYPRLMIHRSANIVELAGTCRGEGQFEAMVYGRHEDDLIVVESVLCIDDLGDEPTANRYGTKEETLARVICDRYELFKARGTKTFISTNLNNEQITERYGVRVSDRLREMCYTINMDGDSARK
jgi:DNA replication protein DnaC